MCGPCSLGAHRFSAARIQRVAESGGRRPRPRVASLTPYLSQWRWTLTSASGESWGRLARTIASGPEEALRYLMLRIIHTADVHLGARHDDLGEVAAAQRERQFAAFKAAVDLALAEKVDLFLVAGDLFDSNVQPRRSVERVVAELARLAGARIRTVIIPGTHDVYDRASIYRAYDLSAMAGSGPDDEMVTVLNPSQPSVHLTALDALVSGTVFDTKRAPFSPLGGAAAVEGEPASWRIGMVHGSIAIPGKTDRDEVVITTDEIAASGLDYLALGHWHSAQTGTAGSVTYAYAGAPEAVALDQDRAGKVLLVELEERAGKRSVTVQERQVGQTKFAKQEIDAAEIASQPALVDLLAAQADPDLVLDARLVGVRSDELDLDLAEIETALGPSFLKVRVRDVSIPALTAGPLPPEDTIAGSFIRDLEWRIAELEATGSGTEAAETRDALRLG
ncbi:MAG: DNA repair exonuclease, partial [Thermomicrobiales bacterium]